MDFKSPPSRLGEAGENFLNHSLCKKVSFNSTNSTFSSLFWRGVSVQCGNEAEPGLSERGWDAARAQCNLSRGLELHLLHNSCTMSVLARDVSL